MEYAPDIEDGMTLCIDFRCNCNCIGCMIKNIRNNLKEKSFDEFKQIIDKNAKEKKHRRIIISGAEATLNERLIEFISYAKRFGNFEHIQLQTNGIKFSSLDYSKRAVDAGLDEFLISVWGDSSYLHDKLTGLKGSFEETMRGIKNLSGLGAQVFTNTVITSMNYDRLPELVKTISKTEGVRTSMFWMYWPMNEKDTDSLLADINLATPYLKEAIRLCQKNDVTPIVKYYPPCVLGEMAQYVNNCLSETIIDDKYWNEFKRNKWSCVYSSSCQHHSDNKCKGLPMAYINNFGWAEETLKPLKRKITCLPDMHDKNLLPYLLHKQKFNIQDDQDTKAFEELMHNSSNYYIECSCKVEEANIYPSRFNIWYNDGNNVKNINLAFSFLKSLSKKGKHEINYSLIKQFIDEHFDMSNVKRVIAGVDYRDKPSDSRAKLWVILNGNHEKVKQAITISGQDNKILELFMGGEFLVGFDFYFDGRTRIKNYFVFDATQLKDESVLKKIGSYLSPGALTMAKKCKRLHVSFKDDGTDLAVHFHPQEYDEFIQNINDERINKINDTFVVGRDVNTITLSLNNSEIGKKIRNFNIYC